MSKAKLERRRFDIRQGGESSPVTNGFLDVTPVCHCYAALVLVVVYTLHRSIRGFRKRYSEGGKGERVECNGSCTDSSNTAEGWEPASTF